jgi:hypothetical protein
MKYMLLMYANESESPTDPETQQSLFQAWVNYMKEGKAAGVLLSNNGLLSVTHATTVRVRDGKTLTADGPFAETHEQLGGFSVVECKDLDEAVRWAAKIPTAKYGTIEVRPLWDNAQQ